MKHTLRNIGAAAVICAMSACSQTQNQPTFRINGTVADEISDTAYFVYIGDTTFNIDIKNAPTDTIIVKDKKFTYTSDIKEPRPIYLQAVFKNGEVCQAYVNFVLVPGETADLKVNNGYFDLDGSTFYKQWHVLDSMITSDHEKIRVIDEQLRDNPNRTQEDIDNYLALVNEIMKKENDYVLAHRNEEAIIYCGHVRTTVSAHQLFDSLPPELRNGRFKNWIDKRIALEDEEIRLEEENRKNLEATGEGKMFTDFSVDYNGKTQKLSDYVGKGKYVLTDFWASWCGPCRSEIPNIINVYNKYKGKKFEVLGVAVMDEPEDSEKAIKDLKINYPQILNAQEEVTKTYGIQGIPEIILFGPDGTIVRRGLRGSEIEATVKECLKK
ncbi:MAG: AhpC/TSA family protein [Bacteroidales bacterium]|nr:AhpC/TSA family protein [Bacteroidales bacterium]